MSRYVAHSIAGYDPLLRIDLRTADEGGAPAPAVVARWKQQTAAQRELLMLVHGYNNHRGEAEAAYAAMRRRQTALLPNAGWAAQFEALLGDAFWPGDARWPGAIDKLDFFYYSSAVGVAKEVAPRIAAYLRTRRDVLVVHFIGHSLGCRVVLETIAGLLASGGSPKIGRVCLMAAAVPTHKVMQGGALSAAVSAPEHLRVLYSPADWVLGATFPPGQTIAGAGEGVMPTAVGHSGDIALSPGRVDREHVPDARHGDYWGGEGNAASGKSTESVREFFRFDRLGSRVLKERPLPSKRPPPERRGVGMFVDV